MSSLLKSKKHCNSHTSFSNSVKKKSLNGGLGIPRSLRKGSLIFVIIMLIPAIYGIMRYVVVNGYSILLAFSNGDPFVDGFSVDNFTRFFQSWGADGEGSIALRNTLIYFAIGIIKLFLSYFVAYFLYKKVYGHKIFRFVFFLPALISPVISVAIYRYLIQEMGPLWTLVKLLFGVEYKDPLSYSDTATAVIVIYQFLTGFGTTYLILLGAMKRIPQDVIDSSRLDGCGNWRELFSIILPMTWSTFSTFLLMDIALVFTSSGPILYFTGDNSTLVQTQTIGYWIFEQVWNGYYNYPAAIGVFFTICGLPILFLVRYLINKIDPGVTY